MRRKEIEKLEPIKTRKSKKIITVQELDNILILNFYEDKQLCGRYCMNTDTYEYESYFPQKEEWSSRKLATVTGYEPCYYSNHTIEKEVAFNSKEDKDKVNVLLKAESVYYTGIRLIDQREKEYCDNKRRNAEGSRVRKIRNLMDKVPEMPKDFKEWIYKMAAGNADYAFFSKEDKKWTCTACGKEYDERFLHRVDGEKKIRHNDMVICPRCKKHIQVKKRNNGIEKTSHSMILQNINDDMSVARHFDINIYWGFKGKKIEISEAMRFLLYRNHPKLWCDIFYGQYSREYLAISQSFDRRNPAQRHTFTGYLYPEGIEESLRGTYYEPWGKLFHQLAVAEKKLHYNRLMASQENKNLIGMVEYLFKGRFNQLLEETSEQISYWSGEYTGPLNSEKDKIEEIFGIADMQKINRIRSCNGGENIVKWMQWSDETGEKIGEDTLNWLVNNEIKQGDVGFIQKRMSIQKIMNYVIKQQRVYKGKSAKAVLNQWDDYLSMCKNQKKNLADEMIYKPRELKRRHDEIVEEINRQNMIEQMKRDEGQMKAEAKKMRDKFPEVEKILKEIKPKYEYQNEEYMVIVPGSLIDIVTEGQALHHCVGSSDRYFDRMGQHETYTLLLRKRTEPDIPYYTLEIEPGGTIRQHRSFYDEEPNIGDIRGFLKEWQQEVKKRMKTKDKELAEISAKKRRDNIEELKQKNNTRVLDGLMEDFMEAI